MTQDPTQRLRTDPRASERLRRDLEYARSHPVDIDVEAGLRELRATLAGSEHGTGLASNSGSATRAKLFESIATKWWAWSVVGAATLGAATLVAATLGFVWWTQHPASPPAVQRPGAAERSATQEERAASSEGRGPATELARRSELREGAADNVMDNRRSGLSQVQGAADAPKAGSIDPRDGSNAAGRRGRVERTSSARARSSRATRDSHASQAASASARADAPDPSPTALTQVPADTYSDSHEAGAGVGAATAAAVATSDASITMSAVAQTSSDDSRGRLENEVAHLARVRRLLSHEPARALTAARAGQATFTGGLFHEERAALIVFSLARLGRAEEALREAHSYLRSYPRGPFALPVGEIVTRFEDRRP